MHLLMHTLIIPLDSEDVERLISALDDSSDKIEATAVRMLIFRIEAPTEKAQQLDSSSTAAQASSTWRCRIYVKRRIFA
jgi:uncharacterized protein Yka (UPF0111/DUF47 family)